MATGRKSALLLWWELEDTKRKNNEPNDLDQAEIVSALDGVENKWSELIRKNPERFHRRKDKIDWEFIFKNRPGGKPGLDRQKLLERLGVGKIN